MDRNHGVFKEKSPSANSEMIINEEKNIGTCMKRRRAHADQDGKSVRNV